MSSVQFSLTMPASLNGQMNQDEALQAWKQHADELAEIERQNISGRTPEDTGTLDSSLTKLTNPDANTIAEVYTDSDTQLTGPWERVYAKYQEGPPLGHTTYTHGMVQYVYGALTEDYNQIKNWAAATAWDAIHMAILSGGNVTVP